MEVVVITDRDCNFDSHESVPIPLNKPWPEVSCNTKEVKEEYEEKDLYANSEVELEPTLPKVLPKVHLQEKEV